MNYKVTINDNIVIVILKNRIDIMNAEKIEIDLNSYITQGYNKFVFNLAEVSYFSSSGVRMIISIRNKVNEKNGRIVLTNLNDISKKIIKTLGLEEKYDIYDSLDAALNSFNY